MTLSQSSSYQISALTAEEMTIPLDWPTQEGWNPGLGDGECFFAAGPLGFLVGKIDGQPVATISAVSYGADFGFIGLYLVEKRFRGQGYGLEIWRQALEYLGGRTMGLDGVVANAESKEVALELFQALLAQIPLGSEIYLDVPELNTQAVELTQSQGMEPCFETARMYAGAVPDLPLENIFGVSSLELG